MIRRIVFGVSGASGMPLAVATLRAFRGVKNLETHLVVSQKSSIVLEKESGMKPADLAGLADAVYDAADMGAGPASGSWKCSGMVVCPCSMSTLASIATGAGQNLLHRACDVCLKERRPLVLVARETPLSLIHFKNMQAVTEAGATVMPFMPSFYAGTLDLERLMAAFAGRILDQFGIDSDLCLRWKGGKGNDGVSVR